MDWAEKDPLDRAFLLEKKEDTFVGRFSGVFDFGQPPVWHSHVSNQQIQPLEDAAPEFGDNLCPNPYLVLTTVGGANQSLWCHMWRCVANLSRLDGLISFHVDGHSVILLFGCQGGVNFFFCKQGNIIDFDRQTTTITHLILTNKGFTVWCWFGYQF